jgi:hypothetical protein
MTWCHWCGSKGYWDQGNVIITEKTVMSLASYGLPITFTGMQTDLVYNIESIIEEATITENLTLQDCIIVDMDDYSNFKSEPSTLVPPMKPERLEIILCDSEPNTVHIDIRSNRVKITGHVKISEFSKSCLDTLCKQYLNTGDKKGW